MSRITWLALAASMALAAACRDATAPAPREPVARVVVEPASAELAAGAALDLRATPRDRNDRPLPDRAVTWSSDAPDVASVTAAGRVTAHRAGTATVTATSEGRQGTTAVTVSPGPTYDLVHSGWPDYPYGEWRLFVTRLGDAASQPLLPADVLPGFALTQAAPSPDGRRIAFTGYDPNAQLAFVFVVNPDGSDLRQLTAGGAESQPAWSPDGRRIAYVVRPRGGEGDIWVMDGDGRNAVNVTVGANRLHQYSPAWSRDLGGGGRIVFGEGDGSSSNLWTMRPDGSDRRRVTSGTQWWDDDPAWSPDGTRIAFQRDGPGTDGVDLWVVDADGANARSLVKLPFGQAYPDWSPDGRLIVFNSSHAQDPVDWFVIYTVASDGSNLVRRTFDPWMSTRPAWRLRP